MDLNNAGPQSSSRRSSDPSIMAIGKYRGRPITEVMQIDTGWIQWALAQLWFREQHPLQFRFIINGGAPPKNTPEHNKMQVRSF